MFAKNMSSTCLRRWRNHKKTQVFRGTTKHMNSFRCLAKAIRMRSIHRNSAPTTISVGHHYTGAFNT